MAFFHNRAVNLFNLHFAVFSVAMLGGGAFFVVFILKSGVSIPLALLALGAVQAVRFVIRPAIVAFASRFGLRRTLIFGTLLFALQFPVLAEVHGVGPALYGLVLVTAVADVFYWSSYHATFAKLGDDEHRGSQIGVQQASMALIGIVSPLLSGWLLVSFGPRAAFYASGAFTLLAALPLLWMPDTKIARRLPGGFRAVPTNILALIAGDGFCASGTVFLWQIALFQSLGESYTNYGGALAIAAVVGAVASLVLGPLVDSGHGVRLVWLAIGVSIAVIVLRAATVGHPVLAIAANALNPLAGALYAPLAMTPVYTRAKASPCVLRFHVATEGGWDAGNVFGCLLAAALIALGVPVDTTLLLPLAGLAISFTVLRRYFAAHPTARLAPAES